RRLIEVRRRVRDAERRERDQRMSQPWTPAVDTFERGDDFVVEMELPGVIKEDVDVTVHARRLVVQGERNEGARIEGSDEERRLRRWDDAHRFYTEVELPEPTRSDRVRATLKNGLLTVLVPRTPRSQRQNVVRIES